jgi:DNA alkylation damage repair protein AlkB
MQLHPGAFYLPGYLALAEQRALRERIEALAGAGLYTPTHRSGSPMRLRMMCFGLHWDAITYRYSDVRTDYDGASVPPVPDDLAALARRVAAEVGMTLRPEVCLVNHYVEGGRLGVHQDKDERPETLRAGIPIVSISLGDTADFQLGGTRRKDPLQRFPLRSGDALVLGGESRLRYHGVARIRPGTGPESLHLAGRFNLTFRQYAP